MAKSPDFDSTMALLSSAVPDVEVIPNYPRPAGDSDEEEVFFGPIRSDRELSGKNAGEYARRKTLKPTEAPARSTPYRADPKDNIPEEEEDKENRIGPNLTPIKVPVTPMTPKSTGQSSKRSDKKTPASRFIDDNNENETDDSRSSFVDVENDQMFDCSIFTEYSERDLSCMSENISNKWRSRLTKEQAKRLKKSRKEPKRNGHQDKKDEDTTEEDFGKLSETMALLNDVDLKSNGVEKVKKNLDFEGRLQNDENFDANDENFDANDENFDANVKNDAKSESEDNAKVVNVVIIEGPSSDEKASPERHVDELQADQNLDDQSFISVASESRSGRRCSIESSRRRSSIGSTCSDWFNTTREEMLLYEKFGEDYDEIVEKMSHEEKVKLKEEIANSVPKDVRELLGDRTLNDDDAGEEAHQLEHIIEEVEEEDERDVIISDDANARDVSKPSSSLNLDVVDSAVNDVSKTSIFCVEETPDVSQASEKKLSDIFREDVVVLDEVAFQDRKPPVPLPRTLTPQKQKPIEEKPASVSKKTPAKKVLEMPKKKRFFKTPEALKTPSYLMPTTASQQRASPRKDACSPSPSRPTTQQVQCTKGNYCSSSPFMQPWPRQSPRNQHRVGLPPIDMAKIVSPVAQYIHNTNVPKVMRNIRPKMTIDLDQELRAIQEFEEREREILNEKASEESAVPKKRFFKPLPEAEYRSSRVALEKQVVTEEPKDLPKKFMTTSSTEAVVVRHLARERVAQEEIRNFEAGSPDKQQQHHIEIGNGLMLVRSTAPARESEEFNQTSVDMSIREVKKINKLTPSFSRRHVY